MVIGKGCEIKRWFSKNENIRTYLYFEEIDKISKETLIQERNKQVAEVMTLTRWEQRFGAGISCTNGLRWEPRSSSTVIEHKAREMVTDADIWADLVKGRHGNVLFSLPFSESNRKQHYRLRLRIGRRRWTFE